MKDREIHSENNVWSTHKGYKKIYEFDVHVGFASDHRLVGYGKQCSLIWPFFS